MFKIPLKKADSGVDFGPQLRNHIQTSYSEDPEIYLDDLRSLKSLRAEALSTEVHVNQLTTLRRYWGQLVYLGSKFPIDEAQIKISFAWYNSYGKSSQKPSKVAQDHIRQ